MYDRYFTFADHCQLYNRVGLRCRNEQESRNVIGEGGLEQIDIDMVGRGVAVSHVKQEFQSFG